jgi:hypothetical protein
MGPAMAINFGGFAVIVRNATLEGRFPGGVEAYAQQAPNGTFTSDGTICAVSFCVFDDASLWANKLVAGGLSDPAAASEDIAIVSGLGHLLTQSLWLKCGLRIGTDAGGASADVPLAWVIDEEPVTFSPPPGWRHTIFEVVSAHDLQQNYEVANVRQPDGTGVVIAYRHRINGRVLYVGRPSLGADDQRATYLRLQNELGRLLAMPISKSRENDLASLLDEAGALARASNDQAIEPIWVQGVAARLLGRWKLAAESLRKVTELNPSVLGAWLELTWALAKLDRLEEAEVSARRAVDIDGRSAPARGNLAGVLLQLGRPEEALPEITLAVELDPTDAIHQMLLERVRQALHHADVPAEPVPWYKRWLQSGG